MALLRHVLRPARPTALLLIATLTLLALSWLLKYAYVLLDLVAEGIDEPPVLSIEMVNPVEQRPLMQLAIGVAGFGLAWWVGGAALETDARAFLARAAAWNDARAYALVAQIVIARLLATRNFALALELFDAARRAMPGVVAATPADTRALIEHARATGRSRFAGQLEAEIRKT